MSRNICMRESARVAVAVNEPSPLETVKIAPFGNSELGLAMLVAGSYEIFLQLRLLLIGKFVPTIPTPATPKKNGFIFCGGTTIVSAWEKEIVLIARMIKEKIFII